MTKVNREKEILVVKDYGERLSEPFLRFIDKVKSQTRNDLLREIMEEMPKKVKTVEHYDGRTFGNPEDIGFNSCRDQVNTLLESKLSTVKK